MQIDHEHPLILIVDDAPTNIQVLAEILRGDYRIKVASHGRLALDIAGSSEDQPDLILLDVMMPDMDGYEVCRRLKENPASRDIPVIFVTARNDAQGEAYGLQLGAVDYISKPCQPAIVKARVQNTLKLRRSAAALKERQGQLDLFIAHAPVAIAMFDRDMRYLAVSQRWLDGFDLDGQAIIGASHYEMCPDLPARWKEIHRRCLAGATERAEADLFERADGSRQWLRWEVRPWTEATGTIGGIVIFCEDISELHRQRLDLVQAKAEAEAAKADAERANSAKSYFLAAASHDLRQPLHALEIYLGVLADSVPANCAGLVGKALQCSTSLSAMLNDLLDLSKLDAGAVKPQASVFPLATLFGQLAITHAPAAEQKDLLFRVAQTRRGINTDYQLLYQLLGNLLSNAIRYTAHGGILIGARRRDGKLWIEVWDTGIGIAADKYAEIFEPFRQLGNPGRDRQEGTGLGLALVRRLAKVMGLQIRVASRPGRGSLFAVEVPGAATAVCPEVAAPGSARQRRRLRVALLEDQAFVRDAVSLGLEHLGHQVIAAANVFELIGGLADQAPDVIVADYRLQGRSTGADAIEAIRRRFDQPLGAVIVTGEIDPDIVRSIAERGLRILFKPVHIEQLQSCLDELASFGQELATAPVGDKPLLLVGDEAPFAGFGSLSDLR